MMICEGKEKLRAFEDRNGISKAIIHLEQQGWWEALGGGGVVVDVLQKRDYFKSHRTGKELRRFHG